MTACPHCDAALFRSSGDKLKARTSMLVLHKSGNVEINCPSCRRGVYLPLAISDQFVMRKAQRFVVRGELDTPDAAES